MYPVQKRCLETLTLVALYGEVGDVSKGQKDFKIEFPTTMH